MNENYQEEVLKLYELQCSDNDSVEDSYLCYGDYDDDSGTPTTC